MRWVVLILAMYGLWLLFLYFKQDQLLYPGAGAPLADAGPPPAGVESLWIEPEPGVRVEAWFMLGRGRSAESPGPAVILTHGNYEVIDQGLWHARHYVALGISALLVEFRGYGRSTGAPTEAGITADMVAFFDRLAARPEVDAKRIVIHGRSIGGGAAAQLAARRTPAALILQSTFVSMDALAARYLAPPPLVRDHWRTDVVVSKLDRPLLLLHGRSDEIIRASNSERLRALSHGAELRLLDGSHNHFPVNEAEYWDAIETFLGRSGVLR
jgi:fermentation-respiration switch protein FrsA (DUF1100 family)